MDNWAPFLIFLTAFSLLSIFAAVFAKPINNSISDLDTFANGKRIEHHVYIPYS